MKRTTCLAAWSLALAVTGCSTPPTASAPAATVSLGVLSRTPARDVYLFGAGDALGQQVFTRYVASLGPLEHYATGESPYPADE